MKVREGGRVVNVHALVATGVNADGYREVLGLQVTTAEDGAGWLTLLPRPGRPRPDRGRGWSPPTPTPGWSTAIGATLPGAAWQRCRTHYAANLMSVTPKASWPVGQDAAALGLRPARRRVRARPVRPARRRRRRQAAEGRRAPRGRPRRRAGVHRVPEGDLAPDLVQQPRAPRGAVESERRWKTSTVGLSQQPGEAEGSLIRETPGEGGSSPDNDGTGRHCQTARVRQARRRGVRVQEPVVEPPQVERRLEPGGSGPVSGARPVRHRRVGRLRVGHGLAGSEATVKGCGVVVARLQGKSWAPIPSIGQQ